MFLRPQAQDVRLLQKMLVSLSLWRLFAGKTVLADALNSEGKKRHESLIAWSNLQLYKTMFFCVFAFLYMLNWEVDVNLNMTHTIDIKSLYNMNTFCSCSCCLAHQTGWSCSSLCGGRLQTGLWYSIWSCCQIIFIWSMDALQISQTWCFYLNNV